MVIQQNIDTKLCPFCGVEISWDEIICTFCGVDIYSAERKELKKIAAANNLHLILSITLISLSIFFIFFNEASLL
jgi:predicted nucleic acid-binding Zn ribbon protein